MFVLRQWRVKRLGVRMRQESGAAAVELALVLSVLVLLVFGIIEFGFLFNHYIAVTHAAREGARLAAVGKFDAGLVRARASDIGSAVAISGPSYGTDSMGQQMVSVTVTYTEDLEIPMWGHEQIPLASTAVMRAEAVP